MTRGRAAIHFVLLGAIGVALARGRGAERAAAPLDRYLDDEDVLYRAALERRVDRDDPIVEARLIQNMRFAGGGDGDAGALLRSAGDLHVADGDLVVRRRLVERMRLLLQEPALAEEPSDDVLRTYLEAHAEQFRNPARVRLVHVFLSRERRGAALAADAARLLSRLGAADVERAAELGDALPLAAALPPASADDLTRLFGAEFAAAALSLPPGGWRGPLISPYGLHLVWVVERQPATMPELAQVRGQVRSVVREERAAAAVRDGIRALRDGDAGKGG